MQVFRGTAIAFETTFVDPDGVALLPIDATAYPQIQIKDPDGVVVTTGVGSNVGGGNYRFSWFCPEDGIINAHDDPWRIEWLFLTISGHSKQTEQTFDVVDKVEADPRERQQTYLSRTGGSARIMIRNPRRIDQISLTVKYGGSVIKFVEGIAKNDEESAITNPNRKIKESVVDGTYVYYFDTIPLTQGEYLIFWDIQETLVSPRDTLVQKLRVVPDVFWHYAVDLRMLVDKLQKRIGTVQAYSDADLYSYLLSGLDTINFYAPTTNWLLTDIPIDGSHGVRSALLYAATIHGLIAQQILEEEVSFTHTGQTVTLTVKHDYTGVITAIKAQLDEYGKAKQQIFVQAEGVGFSGVRPKSYRVLRTVFRVDKAFGPGFLPPGGSSLLQSIGL
ncbi:MAG: hypothetical protein WC505_05810 [Patescibacteria group bacterium]